MRCLQTDGTAYACNKTFSHLEERMNTDLDTKPARFINDEDNFQFNDSIISGRERTFFLIQPNHIRRLTELYINNEINADFVAEQARRAYIADIWRPQATYAFIIAS